MTNRTKVVVSTHATRMQRGSSVPVRKVTNLTLTNEHVRRVSRLPAVRLKQFFSFHCSFVFICNIFSLVHPCDEANRGGCQHICLKRNNMAVCKCKLGFTLEEDGKSCEKGR